MISLMLALVMCLSLCVPAFATEANVLSGEVMEFSLSDGTIYIYKNGTNVITITSADNSNVLEIDVVDLSDASTVYQNFSTDYDKDVLTASPEIILEHVVNDIDDLIVAGEPLNIEITEEACNEAKVANAMRSAATMALQECMEELYGSEYSGRLRYSTTKSGQSIKIYEELEYQITKDWVKNWQSTTSAVLTLGSLIAALTGHGVTSTLLACLSIVFAVAPSANAELTGSGTLTYYNCKAVYMRTTSINGSTYQYNYTDKVLYHEGYDCDGADGVPAIDTALLKTAYLDNASYYNSYNLQMLDAYDKFLELGQRD